MLAPCISPLLLVAPCTADVNILGIGINTAAGLGSRSLKVSPTTSSAHCNITVVAFQALIA